MITFLVVWYLLTGIQIVCYNLDMVDAYAALKKDQLASQGAPNFPMWGVLVFYYALTVVGWPCFLVITDEEGNDL